MGEARRRRDDRRGGALRALADEPATAEFAIVVGDAWQRQGVGRELMGRLADAAVTRGCDRFRPRMLADNVAIQRLIGALAAGPLAERRAAWVDDVEVEFGAARSDRAGVPAMIAACAGS